MSKILTNKWFKLGCVLFVYLLWTGAGGCY